MLTTVIPGNGLGQDAAIRLDLTDQRGAVILKAADAALRPEKKIGSVAPNPATLRWHNGESLAGEPLEASATELTWRSPFFEDPLILKWEALRRIDRVLEPATSSEPFSIALRDGSHLFGDVVAVSEETITIRSARHDEAVLKRAEVLSARRLEGGNLVTGGPAGESRWRVVADTAKNLSALATTVPIIRSGAGGALDFPYWNRGAILEVAMPELVDVEFRVRSSHRPDFQLALGAGGAQRLRVETWDEDLVLTAGRAFKSIRKLTDTEREVALRICWDRRTQKCAVFSSAGERIAEWDVPLDASNANQQVLLQNKGRDLSLELLRVRKWDGQPPAKIAGKLPRAEFADGRIVEGRIGAGTPGAIALQADGADSATIHPLSEVEALVFSSDRPKLSESETTLAYADGTLLHGRIESIQDGRASLRTGFCDEPLGAQIAGLRQMLRQPLKTTGATPEPPLAEWDTLVLPNLTLHGRLASTGDARPRWLPVGGVRPVLPSGRLAVEMRRAFPPKTEHPGAEALFYINTGDVLPGRLRGLDRTGVEIESEISEITTLPTASLDAVQFGAATASSVQGFTDPAWRILRGVEQDISRTADSAELETESALGHPSVMSCSEIQFRFVVDGGVTGVRLWLFTSGDEYTSAPSLLLAGAGTRFYFSLEEGKGRAQGNLQTANVIGGASFAVRLVIDEKQLQLHVNGSLVRSFPLPAQQRRGFGMVFEPPEVVLGNGVRTVKLSDFAATSGAGGTWVPAVSADAKSQALTVPRFRKDDPPRHVLLAANGDVLRGEIEAATASHFRFRSVLENLRVPRDRVRAAIWLKPPDKNAPPPEPPSAMMKALEQKLTRRVRYSSASLSTLTGVLQREVGGLKFTLPAMADPPQTARVTLQFAGQTVAEALDEICGLFALRYRVDGETIVLEARAPAASELVEKEYWLKSSAFPTGESAPDALAKKGIPFPAKSSTTWRPLSGRLTVVNTAANHEKLAAVLAAEFGGRVDSPTHWLLLTSGARLGLTVEKFEPDAVSGSHPVFGRCRVPMSGIHTIRTSPPEPTPAMKALADWRLVDAPEPALPEAGGESSPTLGKAAAAFKLPLLDGGEFDLAASKGKVVVLDFWATWCGPCIKSIPALIEAMSAFPSDRVTLLGVNQSEPPEQVKRFLETRGWRFAVALDAGQKVARQYGVEGIPHTVIIGPDGNVAWVKTGFSPAGAAEAAEAVKTLLGSGATVPQ